MTLFATFAPASCLRVDSSVRPLAVTTLFAFLLYGAPCALPQRPLATPPAAKSFHLGGLDISVLRDDSLAVPNDGSIFGLNANPLAVAKVLSQAGAPTDEIRLDIDALLIRMQGHFVLIDTGYGPAGHGVLLESLALAGVSPGEITDILITHAHPDHIGGLVDEKGRSVFAKATIRMSSTEWAYMQTEPVSFTHVEISAIKSQVHTFEPGKLLLPSITPLPLPGHTPGQVGYEIASQGYKLLDTGDLAHSSIISLREPGWTIKWDVDKKEGAMTRREELQRLATTQELMFSPHFPFPGVGRIERAGEGFRFRPEVLSGR